MTFFLEITVEVPRKIPGGIPEITSEENSGKKSKKRMDRHPFSKDTKGNSHKKNSGKKVITEDFFEIIMHGGDFPDFQLDAIVKTFPWGRVSTEGTEI